MSSQYEENYAKLVNEILAEGTLRKTRNANTYATFGKTLVVDELRRGYFPILSSRKMYYKGVLAELAAFLKGPKHIKDFEDEGCNYWGKWADDSGDIRVDYGNLWTDFNGVNQLDQLLQSLATDPNGRRHIISGWNPGNLHNLSLPCCHLLYQWYVDGDELQMIWYQRSVDTMIGLPSDVILAAAWNILVARYIGLNPGRLIFMLGDTHIYESHLRNARVYCGRVASALHQPVEYFNEGELFDFNKESIQLIDYNPDTPLNFELH